MNKNIRTFFKRIPAPTYYLSAILLATLGTAVAFFSAASATSVQYSSYLTPTTPSKTYSVTASYSGTMTATLSYSRISNASLSLYDTNGNLLARATGASPITLKTTVSAGTYKYRVAGSVSSSNNNFGLKVTLPAAPVADTTAPSAPTNLSASATSQSQIQLAWTASTDNVKVTGYDVYRNNTLIGTSASTTYTDSSLSPSTSYSYTLKAFDAAGNRSALSSAASATTQADPTLSPFVTTSGTNFMLKGAPFRFIGFNAYGMAGCYNGSPWTTAELDTYFSNLPPNGVTRLWAFKSYGTAAIQTIVTEAAKYNQRVILTLGDDDSNCGESDGAVGGAGSGKTQAFYTTGWQGAYLTWVKTIVPMFKDNPTVMMWEVANEPGQVGYVPTPTEMQAYLKGASDAIRAQDANHLIGVGSNIAKNYGGATYFTQAMSLPNINAVSFHDYSYEYESGAVVSANFNTAKQVSQSVNKPFYAGEAGVPAGSTCSDVQYSTLTLTSRVNSLKQKTDSYFTNGIGGVMYWEYEPSKASWVGNCAYEIYPSDPLVTTVKTYQLP